MKIHETAQIAKGAVVFGDVTIGEKSNIWYNAVVRGDDGPITVGKCSNIQDNCVVHVDAGHSVEIGKFVTVGHGAIVHGCKIGDQTLVGMGAIILNGAVIGKNCMIGAGALVTQNTVIPDNSLVIGSPGKILRQVKPEEAAANRVNAEHYIEEGRSYAEYLAGK